MSLYNVSPVRFALVRPLPASFAKALTQHVPTEPIDVKLAHEQHENYSRIVRSHVERLVSVAVEESCPDCCFIEDAALVVGSTVIMSRSGAASRRPEAALVLAAFHQLAAEGLPLRIESLREPATLDGGDVLQMEGRLFVGLSARSNLAAVAQLREILGAMVVQVPVAGALHLKSLLSALDDQTLLVADRPEARAMGEHILSALPAPARMVTIPDSLAANVVRLGSVLLVQAGLPRSEAILSRLAAERGLTMIPVCMSELAKADGALTCCSIIMP